MNTLTKVLAGLLAISAFWLWWVIDDYDKLSKDYNTATNQLS
ncbi:lysis protein, partial [Proteus mirabilis]|nr:lysis protein [Proteus mirabilis]